MSSPDITGILETSKELDRLRKELEDILQEINKLHKKLQSGTSLLPIFVLMILLFLVVYGYTYSAFRGVFRGWMY